MRGWIGIDLDGTLAHYEGWVDINTVGEPIPAMLERVERWIAHGIKVKILTARVSVKDPNDTARKVVQAWTMKHLGVELEVTNCKDFGMVRLYDDRAIQVETNTGKLTCGEEPDELS